MQHPPLHLVTGFLGSGKTLFLRSLLERRVFGANLAIILNDFGDEFFDSFLLGKSSSTLVEVPGGCLCCSAVDDFRQAITETLLLSPDRILVEATGLADAAGVCADLAFMGFPVDSVICIVDILHFTSSLQRFAIFKEQIAAADFILLSKADVTGHTEEPIVREAIHSINPRAVIHAMHKGSVATDVLIEILAPVERIHFPPHEHQDHLFQDTITSFHISSSLPVEKNLLEHCLLELPSGIVRIKGRVELQESGDSCSSFLLNYVCGRWTYEPFQNEIMSKGKLSLFLIGQKVLLAEIKQAFAPIGNLLIVQGTFSS